jgi:hypothetical protein
MTITRTTTFLIGTAVLATLTACGHSTSPSSGSVVAHGGSLRMADGQVIISGSDGTEARISPEGRLTIGSGNVTVSDGERAQLVAYYNAASAVYEHGAATGMAGAQLGMTAASGAASGLANGDMSDMKAKVAAQAGEVKRQALKICENLNEVRAAQDALAGQIPAFKPYAVVSERETSDCARDTKNIPGN